MAYAQLYKNFRKITTNDEKREAISHCGRNKQKTAAKCEWIFVPE